MYQMRMDNETFNDLKDMVRNQAAYYYEEWDRLSTEIETRNEVYYEFVLGMSEDFSILAEVFDNAVDVSDEEAL